MARGHQKALSQQRNAEKTAKAKKAVGSDQKNAAMASLHHKCTVCMVRNKKQFPFYVTRLIFHSIESFPRLSHI
ncbi:Small EDRK-rich factor-like N-terminal domain-containing protein [Caenorhabditis elegans]|uniref:Small EDRK-rich factor-like N-terminal domain-containing protein n=1 Tax=Caenorhabditis elegans TaxID=6239 RepID=G5ED15_CAEEL|nr:Small EDRK-rich factor-like N-terminal domain-containing protein [Caenorhabditis elegans]CCD64597.1 Small EDRK-rich factor-like N-terminal domain-containing protein [Caenorhabditis elegans]|eukprot:NP_001024782.1 Uncharacterized protein CELE_K10B3.1 [Caenorhabditis elegans]